MVRDYGRPGWDRSRLVAVLATALISLSVPAFSPALGEESEPELPEAATTSPHEEEAAHMLRKAVELLASADQEAAQKLIDDFKASWEEAGNLDEDGCAAIEKCQATFEQFRELTPAQVAAHLGARDRLVEATREIMAAAERRLPHGPTLEEAERTLHEDFSLLRSFSDLDAVKYGNDEMLLGLIHARRRDWSLAVDSLERCRRATTDHYPDDAFGLTVIEQWLAWALMMEGKDFARQKEYLEAVIAYAEADQDNEESRYWPLRATTLLAEAHYRHGDREEADRLFDEVRRGLPKDPEPCTPGNCTGTCYLSWCQAWCDRHDARRLIDEGRYEEAIAAIERARELLELGAQRELSAGVTYEELRCLTAKAMCGLGRPEEVAEEMAMANAIAEHAARLRGETHVPLESPLQEDAATKPKLVVHCSRESEGLFLEPQVAAIRYSGNSEPEDITFDAFVGDLKTTLQGIENSVEGSLAAGNLPRCIKVVLFNHQALVDRYGTEHEAVRDVAHLQDNLLSLEKLCDDDWQKFCQAYALLWRKAGFEDVRERVFPPFESLDCVVDRLVQARSELADLPEPACGFQRNCNLWLARTYVFRRDWKEAERLLEGACSDTENHAWLPADSRGFRRDLAFVLAEQGKDYPRQKELLETQRRIFDIEATEQSYLVTEAILAERGGRWDEADRLYEEVRSSFDPECKQAAYHCALCDRDLARRFLADDDVTSACELIEDVYPRMLAHAKGTFNYGLEIERTLRLRAEIYERLGRRDEAEADIAYADDIARHAEMLGRLCAADRDQRRKWRTTKLNIPGLPEAGDEGKCGKTAGIEEWLHADEKNDALEGSVFR